MKVETLLTVATTAFRQKFREICPETAPADPVRRFLFDPLPCFPSRLLRLGFCCTQGVSGVL